MDNLLSTDLASAHDIRGAGILPLPELPEEVATTTKNNIPETEKHSVVTSNNDAERQVDSLIETDVPAVGLTNDVIAKVDRNNGATEIAVNIGEKPCSTDTDAQLIEMEDHEVDNLVTDMAKIINGEEGSKSSFHSQNDHQDSDSLGVLSMSSHEQLENVVENQEMSVIVEKNEMSMEVASHEGDNDLSVGTQAPIEEIPEISEKDKDSSIEKAAAMIEPERHANDILVTNVDSDGCDGESSAGVAPYNAESNVNVSRNISELSVMVENLDMSMEVASHEVDNDLSEGTHAPTEGQANHFSGQEEKKDPSTERAAAMIEPERHANGISVTNIASDAGVAPHNTEERLTFKEVDGQSFVAEKPRNWILTWMTRTLACLLCRRHRREFVMPLASENVSFPHAKSEFQSGQEHFTVNGDSESQVVVV